MLSLLDVPGELLIRILNESDACSILSCGKTCRELAGLIDSSVELQYRVELAMTGMVDGPPSEASLRERLDALRAYRAARAAGAHPLQYLEHEYALGMVPFLPYYGGCSGKLMPFSRNAREGPDSGVSLVFHVPALPFSRVRRKTYTFEGWSKTDPETGFMWMCFAFDLAQNLLVRSQITIVENVHVYVECACVCPTDGFRPHPLAAPPILRMPTPVTDDSNSHTLQIFGDLVAWSTKFVSEDDELAYEAVIFNWKTGVIVWRGKSAHQWWDIALISESRLVVVDPLAAMLQLYEFDPSASVDVPHMEHFLEAVLTCRVLFLPESPDGVQRTAACFIQHPPRPPLGSQPMFSLDPALTVLGLKIRVELPVSREDHVDRPSNANKILYTLLIPLQTLHNAFLETPSPNAGTRPIGGVAPGTRGQIYLWDEWGPHGTRFVPHAISGVLGAQAIRDDFGMDSTKESLFGSVATIYEVFPLPSACGDPSYPHSPAATSPDVSELESLAADPDTLADPRAWTVVSEGWKFPVYTSYPCRTTKRWVPFNLAIHHQTGAILPSHDGLVALVDDKT